MISITKIFEFHAAHKLCDEKIFGKCANLHGHTYKLEVTVGLEDEQMQGKVMVMNFTQLKSVVNAAVIDHVDHQYLNEILDTDFPTAEMCIQAFKKGIEAALADFCQGAKIDPAPQLLKLRLYETTNSFTTWNKTKPTLPKSNLNMILPNSQK